ncbi:DUF3180 domain-containing protein [Enemella sp. A6]|uniref:DUF3180 domain-containing protein n=1 Tax=Enemella sp. A6 TaxID=3440152 RepID=UPI003EC01272
MSQPQPEPPRLTLTSWRLLITAVLVGGVLVWFITDLIGRSGATPPSVPPAAPLMLALAAIVVAVFGYRMRQRVHVQRVRVNAFEAVRLLVLGKSAALGGAVVLGGYLGYALVNLPRWDAAAPRERVIWSLVAVLTSAGLVAAGLYLERACKRPEDEDEETSAEPEPTD